jgi:hypothetical protein
LALKTDPGENATFSVSKAGENGAAATQSTQVLNSQIDLVERVNSVSSERKQNAPDTDHLSQADVALEKAGPSEGIAANVSDLSCTWALPGTNRWSRNWLAIGINATKFAIWKCRSGINAVAPGQRRPSSGCEVLRASTGDWDGSNTIRAAGVAGVSVDGTSALDV